MTTPTLPTGISLSPEARLFMLTWLEADVACGTPLTADRWREVYGKAADYQTAQVVRAELAMVERGAA